MQSLATSLLQAIAGKAHERGILDEAAERAFVERFVQQGIAGSMASVGKVRVKSKKSSNSLPFLAKKKKNVFNLWFFLSTC